MQYIQQGPAVLLFNNLTTWICFTYPSLKQPTENTLKGEALLKFLEIDWTKHQSSQIKLFYRQVATAQGFLLERGAEHLTLAVMRCDV